MRSTSGKRSVLVLPRLKKVSMWPRASASAVMCRPMKRVPPSMSMRRGWGFFAAQTGVNCASAPAAARDNSVRRFMRPPWRSPRAGLGVLRDPLAHGLVPEQGILRLQHPVILVRKIHQLRSDAALLQRIEQFDSVVDGHAQVIEVVDDQRGRLE